MGCVKKLLKSGAAAGAVAGALPAAFMLRNMAQLRLREAGAERLEEAGVIRYPDQVREKENPRSMEEVMASIRDIPLVPVPADRQQRRQSDVCVGRDRE